MRTLLTLSLAALALAACSKLTEPPKPEPVQTDNTPPPASAEPKNADRPGEKPQGKLADNIKPAPDTPPPTNEKVESKDVTVGKGAEAKAGDTVSVHYTGTLTDGKEFDSSKKHGQPFTFELGAGKVIKGWDQGVAGMKVGGKRKLTIPPSLAYGARGFPPVIPPNSTLNFDIELLEVKKK
jgi:FKBP-type peptidyl-prolyl cis-trans isomerase